MPATVAPRATVQLLDWFEDIVRSEKDPLFPAYGLQALAIFCKHLQNGKGQDNCAETHQALDPRTRLFYSFADDSYNKKAQGKVIQVTIPWNQGKWIPHPRCSECGKPTGRPSLTLRHLIDVHPELIDANATKVQLIHLHVELVMPFQVADSREGWMKYLFRSSGTWRTTGILSKADIYPIADELLARMQAIINEHTESPSASALPLTPVASTSSLTAPTAPVARRRIKKRKASDDTTSEERKRTRRGRPTRDTTGASSSLTVDNALTTSAAAMPLPGDVTATTWCSALPNSLASFSGPSNFAGSATFFAPSDAFASSTVAPVDPYADGIAGIESHNGAATLDLIGPYATTFDGTENGMWPLLGSLNELSSAGAMPYDNLSTPVEGLAPPVTYAEPSDTAHDDAAQAPTPSTAYATPEYHHLGLPVNEEPSSRGRSASESSAVSGVSTVVDGNDSFDLAALLAPPANALESEALYAQADDPFASSLKKEDDYSWLDDPQQAYLAY
ncbi:unnamed protein product [Peniophora sp. CBMAI 1063]|nr:unnamed protein product [Peniophora sp. CBMAI 1063]